MTWPTVAVTTTNLDAGSDSPSSARPDILDLTQKFNQLIAHPSSDGRDLIASADKSAMRTFLGLAIGTNVQAFDSDLATIAANVTALGHSLIAAADESSAQSLLGLEIGVDVQAFDTDLSTIASSITAFGHSVIAAADAAAGRTLLGVSIGSAVQAHSDSLDQIAALSDPNADRLLFWDDSAGQYAHLTLGTNLSITGTTLNAAGSSDTEELPVGLVVLGAINMAQNGTRYLSALGNVTDNQEAANKHYVQYPMTVSKLRAKLSANVAASQTCTVKLRKNGVDAITFTISAGSSTGSETATSVHFDKGDFIAVSAVLSATFGSTTDIGVSFVAKLFGTQQGAPVHLSFNTGDSGVGASFQAGNFGTFVSNVTYAQGWIPVREMVLDLFVLNAMSGSATGAQVVKNATTLPNTALAAAGSVSAAGIAYSDGDKLNINGITGGDIIAAILPRDHEGTILPYAPMLFHSLNQAQNTTVYAGGYIGANQSATETDVQVPVSAANFKNLRAVVNSALPSGQTCTVTVRKNGVDTALTLTITSGDGTTSVKNIVNEIAFADDDILTIKVVLSATTGSRYVVISLEAMEL